MKSSPRARFASIVLGCVGLLGLGLVGSGGWFIDKALRVLPISQLLASPGDDHTYLASRLSRQAGMNNEHRDRIQLNVFGASTVRESFISADYVLSSAISARLGQPVAFNNLGSTAQNLRETLVLVDNAVSARGCLNFVGVSPLRFQFPENAPNRIPLRSLALARFDREHGSPRGVGESLSAYYHWQWLSRWWTARMTGRRDNGVSYVAKRHLVPRALPATYLDGEWRRLAAKNSSILQHLSANMDLVEQIIESSKSHGCTTILFEQAHHPLLIELQRPIEDTYRQRLTRVLEKRKVSYLNYRAHVDLDASDFADHLHLSAAGKKRFEAWFVAEIVDSNFIREI